MNPSPEPIEPAALAKPEQRVVIVDRTGVRVLVLGWCTWLLGAWGAALAFDSAVPAGRWMIFSTMTGLMAVWPAFRLSQPRTWAQVFGGPSAGVLLDWVSLILVAQAVVWPLLLSAGWSIAQAGWIDATLIAWSLITALIVAVACQFDLAIARWLGMMTCLLLILAEPVFIALTGRGGTFAGEPAWHMHLSPIEAVWSLTQPAGHYQLDPWPSHIISTLAAAMLGWALLLVWVRRTKFGLNEHQGHN